jgi:hypothetical protein
MTKPKASKAAAPAASYKKDVITIDLAPDSTNADIAGVIARTLTLPQTNAAAVIENWQKDTHDVNALAAELGRQVEAVNGGDLRRAEGMLIAQAHTLDSIFTNLARRATTQEYLKQWETYMRMAMKAQNQCRMTLETLAAIKNPPVVYARQANINNGGQQQVNNGPAPNSTPTSAHPQETAFQPNELLEDHKHGSTQLDAGATTAAAGGHSELEAMGTGDRPEERARKVAREQERMERRNSGGAA